MDNPMNVKYTVKRAIRSLVGDARSVSILNRFRKEKNETGGSSDGHYSYSVFCRHKVKLKEKIGLSNFHTVCEFGPGDALTIGLLHLSTGSKRLLAFDGYPYFDRKKTVTSYKEAVKLLMNQTDIPNCCFPSVFPKLDDYRFPRHIDGMMVVSELNPDLILNEINQNIDQSNILCYFAPYEMSGSIFNGTVDLITSQAVMEHVKDIGAHYKFQYQLLSNGGVALHQIDLKSHGTSLLWNGHWSYSEEEYQKVMKTYTFRWINRLSLERHIELMKDAGFEIIDVERYFRHDGIKQCELNDAFKNMTSLDLSTSSATVIIRKS